MLKICCGKQWFSSSFFLKWSDCLVPAIRSAAVMLLFSSRCAGFPKHPYSFGKCLSPHRQTTYWFTTSWPSLSSHQCLTNVFVPLLLAMQMWPCPSFRTTSHYIFHWYFRTTDINCRCLQLSWWNESSISLYHIEVRQKQFKFPCTIYSATPLSPKQVSHYLHFHPKELYEYINFSYPT